MANFGYETIGGTEAAATQPTATKWTAPASGDITSMTMYCGVSVGTTKYRMAVYANSGSAPAGKLAESASELTLVSGTDGLAWRSLNVSLAITSGTVYWLAFFADSGGARTFWDAGDTGQA